MDCGSGKRLASRDLVRSDHLTLALGQVGYGIHTV